MDKKCKALLILMIIAGLFILHCVSWLVADYASEYVTSPEILNKIPQLPKHPNVSHKSLIKENLINLRTALEVYRYSHGKLPVDFQKVSWKKFAKLNTDQIIYKLNSPAEKYMIYIAYQDGKMNKFIRIDQDATVAQDLTEINNP